MRATRLLRRLSRQSERIVIEHRRKPPLGLLDAPAFAARVVLDLIALDLADAEVMRVRMAEIESRDRRAGPHREALGELHIDSLTIDQAEQRPLLGVIRLGGVTRRRPDAAIFL